MEAPLMKSETQKFASQHKDNNPIKPPKTIPHDLKVRGELQTYIDDNEYAKFYECIKTNLELYHYVPPLAYYNDIFIPILQRGKSIELTYTVAALMREIAAKYPPTFNDPKKCWSPLTDKEEKPYRSTKKEYRNRQHWERLHKVLKVINGAPLPTPSEVEAKKYGPDAVRRLGYRIWLEIVMEILEFDLDNCSNRKETMMYKLLLESSGKRDQRTIVDYLTELIDQYDAEAKLTRKLDSLVVVQHLLSLMIRAVDVNRIAEKKVSPSQPSSSVSEPVKMETESIHPKIKKEKSEDELDSNLASAEEWYETIAAALRKLSTPRKRVLLLDTMTNLEQKSRLLHAMLKQYDSKGICKSADELSADVLRTYFKLFTSRLPMKHRLEVALILTVLVTVEVSLHHTLPTQLVGVADELNALRESLEEDLSFSLRLCMWEALRLCGSNEAEPQITESDSEGEDSQKTVVYTENMKY